MDEFKIIDIAGNKERQFTPESFRTTGLLEDSGLILITGITESNLKDAITVAKSAHESRAVTAGILSGNINPLNQNMKGFLDFADAVIVSRVKNEDTSRAITDSISALVTKSGFVNIDIEDVEEIFRDAGTVYFGTGTAKSAGVAALKASEMCGDITNSKRFLINITTGTETMLSEMSEAAHVIAMNAGPDAQIIWGHVIDEDMGVNVRVSVFAAMNDK